MRSQYHWSQFQHFFQRPHKMNGRAQRSGHLTWGMCPFRSAHCLSDRKAKCSSVSPSRHWQEMMRKRDAAGEVAAVLMSHQPAGFRPILHVQTACTNGFMPLT